MIMVLSLELLQTNTYKKQDISVHPGEALAIIVLNNGLSPGFSFAQIHNLERIRARANVEDRKGKRKLSLCCFCA
jgi:hypothetical protein